MTIVRGDVARLFVRRGLTAFGVPAAHITMREEKFVRRCRWLAPEELVHLLGVANLIAGPNSTEPAIHIGHRMGRNRQAHCCGRLLHYCCSLDNHRFRLVLRPPWRHSLGGVGCRTESSPPCLQSLLARYIEPGPRDRPPSNCGDQGSRRCRADLCRRH